MKNNKKNKIKVISILLIFMIAVFLIYYINNESISIDNNDDLNEFENEDEIRCKILNDVCNSIVGIKTTKQSIISNNVQNGTGVIISNKGYILTNEHVSGSENDVDFVTLNNGNELIGKVIWADKDVDLAIIKINSKDELKEIKIGNSDYIKIGENVYAIGNPLGIEFRQSVTSGIISGLNRVVEIESESDNNVKNYVENLIQTDASINVGNSGGALINKYGELIGINTIKISSAEGMGFAIPINLVKGIINKLNNNVELKKMTLGLLVYDKNVIKYNNLNINLEDGIYVADMKKNSISERSGIKKGDIIKKIDGIYLNSIVELKQYLYEKREGDIIKITLDNNKDIFIKL